MSLYPLTALQARIVELSDALAGELAPAAASHDREGSFAPENLERLHRAGFLRLAIPREFGGEGAGACLRADLPGHRRERRRDQHLRDGVRPRQHFARRRAGSDRDADRRRLSRQRQENLRHRRAGLELFRHPRAIAAQSARAAWRGRQRDRRRPFARPASSGGVARRLESSDLRQFRRDLPRRIRPRGFRRRAPAASWPGRAGRQTAAGQGRAGARPVVADDRRRLSRHRRGRARRGHRLRQRARPLGARASDRRYAAYSRAHRDDGGRSDRGARAAPRDRSALARSSRIARPAAGLRVAGGFSLTAELSLERYFRDARAGLFQPPQDDLALGFIGRDALASARVTRDQRGQAA